MSDSQTIRVSRQVHSELEKLGGKADTFDGIIRKLLAGAKR